MFIMGFSDIIFWPFMALTGLVAFVIALAVLIFWIWMIVDAAKRKYKNDAEKIIWILVIVFTTWIGALVYLLTIKLTNPKGLLNK